MQRQRFRIHGPNASVHLVPSGFNTELGNVPVYLLAGSIVLITMQATAPNDLLASSGYCGKIPLISKRTVTRGRACQLASIGKGFVFTVSPKEACEPPLSGHS
jgi:hypothetical protein